MTTDLTAEKIEAMTDQELNGVLLRHAKRGPYAWAVFLAEDVLERRRKEGRAAENDKAARQ